MAEIGVKQPQPYEGQKVRWGEKFVTLALLFILLTAAASGVTLVLAGPDWGLLWKSLLIGLLLGWGLAALRKPAWLSALLIVLLGVLLNLLSSGGLSGPLVGVFVELIRLPAHLLRASQIGAVDLSALNQQTALFANAVGVVVGRIFTWTSTLLSTQSAYDPVAARFVWSVLVWMTAAWAGWVVEAAHNALLAVVPVLGVFLTSLSYGQRSTSVTYLVLGITLVLMAVVQYGRRENEWEQTRVAYPPRKNRQVGNTALILAAVLVILSALLSSLSLQRFEQWVDEFRQPSTQPESGLAKSLGVQQPTAAPDAFSKNRSPGLPRQLLIGSGPELSTKLVMSVEVNGMSSSQPGQQMAPLYWRSFTYDVYTGNGWSTSGTSDISYSSNQAIQPENLPSHISITQVVRPVAGAGGSIYAAGEPVLINVPSSAAWRSSQDLFGIQTGSSGYDVRSMLPVASQESLRAAGQAYPAWVAQRYLALPDEVPPRVKELAFQLTASQPTPYDRAQAIEQYLRKFPYTVDVSRPPVGQDLVDYFLFDLQKGYCDYYASAMVVLARAAGIPARLAVGYATGNYNLHSGLYIVTQADAHSWVEVYFPGIGWVPFEPTASRPATQWSNQGAGPTAAPSPTPTATKAPPVPAKAGGNLSKTIGLSALLLVVVMGAGWTAYDELHLSSLPPRQAAAEIYRRMRRYGRLLKVIYQPGETPLEFAELLSAQLQNLFRDGSTPTSARDAAEETRSLADQLVRMLYRPSTARLEPERQMVSRWRGLRWHFRLLWLLNSWYSLRQGMEERLRRIMGMNNGSFGA